MELKYEYVHFVQIENPGRKTELWECRNNRSGDVLGIVKWYGAWRQYCFFPNRNTIFNIGCLHTTADFIGIRNTIHKTHVSR